MIQLASHFRNIDRSRHSEWLNQRKWFIKAKVAQERREEIAEHSEDSFIALVSGVIIATEIQIHEFQTRMDAFELKLDDYDNKLIVLDEAVARALLEQIRRLDMLEAEKQTMLESAFTLEDGRKVFRSRDGTFAVDDSGTTLTQIEFDSSDIPSGPNTAEDYLAKLEAIGSTKSEIDKLHKAQQEIDVAREQSADARGVLKRGHKLTKKEGVSVDELDDLESELDAAIPKSLPNIPASAMKFISGVDSANAPAAGLSFFDAAAPAQSISTIKPMGSVPSPEL